MAIFSDANWVRHSFLVNRRDLDDYDKDRRYYSSASAKFTDTTPGGNYPINPPYQFTSHADPKAIKVNITTGAPYQSRETQYMDPNDSARFGDGRGMGRYYSEAIDDNSQVIHMRFGVAKFNSLSPWFANAYDTNVGHLARTGETRGTIGYTLGRVFGFVVIYSFWELWALKKVADTVAAAARVAMNAPASKFYYIHHTMPLYWNAVTTIVNTIAVNKGIIPKWNTKKDEHGAVDQVDDNEREELHAAMPEIFDENGRIQIYGMANRAQRLARANYKKADEEAKRQNYSDLNQRYNAILEEEVANEGNTKSYDEYMNEWFASQALKPDTLKGDELPAAEPKPNAPGDLSVAEVNAAQDKDNASKSATGISKWELFWTNLTAELDDGSAFASFRVNSTGPVSETFTNNVEESELARKINNQSASARSTTFDFAGGNITDGAVGTMITAAKNLVTDVVAGTLDSLALNGLSMLAGAAFVDVPKHWASSVAQLPRANYTINLVSPYGNPVSQLLDLYIPLSMLLAGALPLATGKQSYTSPFLCEMFDKGRCQTRLGMIDSLTVTRGVGNLGFNNRGNAMAIDVTFSVIDMSSIMYMPIAEGFNIGRAALNKVTGGLSSVVGAAFDEDTAFTDYMNVLGALSLGDQIHYFRKMRLNVAKANAAADNFFTIPHFTNWLGDTPPVKLFEVFFKGTAR